MYGRSSVNFHAVAIMLAVELTLSATAVGQQQPINFGMTGSWFEPATSGQGFLLDVVVGQDPPQIVLYWFTYAGELGGPEAQRWFIAQGAYQPGDSSVMLDVLMVTGGAFNTRPPEPEAVVVGAAELQFHGCTEATFTYDINLDADDSQHVVGEIPIQRLSPDVECENLADENVDPPPNVITAVLANEVVKEVVGEICVSVTDLDPLTLLQFIENSAALMGRCFPRHDLIDTQGKQLTAGEWVQATGEAEVTCIEEGTQYDFRFEGLVPNGVYTIWHFPATGAGALASHTNDINNVFTAAASGTTIFSVIGTAGPMTFNGSAPECTLPLASSDFMGVLFVVVYHIDNRSWGSTPGPQDTTTGHLVFVL